MLALFSNAYAYLLISKLHQHNLPTPIPNTVMILASCYMTPRSPDLAIFVLTNKQIDNVTNKPIALSLVHACGLISLILQ